MRHTTRYGRLAGLAVGLGVGAALAATPGIAWADDFQISIDGMDLFPTIDNSATATSTMGDMAIAFGDGANAIATTGSGNLAVADGAGSTAEVGTFGTSYLDSAVANGAGSVATTGEGDFDTALANGAGSGAGSGDGNGDTAFANGTDASAFAGGDSVTDGNVTTNYPGSDDFAYALGPHTEAIGGGYFGVETPSSNDVALVIDPFGTAGSTASAGTGDYDFAAAFGDMLHAMAVAGNDMISILPSL
jgi:hypothetical protein